ncbi:hypothetical protein [Parasphingorhabdus halotolerans]|uniref:Uncharacterized protein n=1 Tax=Parasphingorhabdus halotolerans TaxID=2725558 RepID=A0A6H2DJT7_9SPHN|nr:hypothetical protein [Parasphingorhabdus halotolerans]QJB68011.1 hypothetical protein HF685_00725 [Parasphingorhabdus halotolerans]
MNQIVETFRHSQNNLISALDGHDSDAIFQASKELSRAVSRLGSLEAADIEKYLRPLMSEVDELMQASIYRLRFLRDHSSSRLQLLSGWQANHADTYSNSARSR